MSKLMSLKSCNDLSDLARLLGYKSSSVSSIIYKTPEAEKYTSFSIPKRSGGKRIISAPNPKLKKLQSRLLDLLVACEKEISESNNNKKPLSHAFKKNLSIFTNAYQHTNNRFVLNVDIKDFFPSINFGRVRGYFIKNKDYALTAKVATAIAQIACHQNTLPQGSPCSPLISDFIGRPLDSRLLTLAKRNGCTYSRYADDLTFSTNLKIFPKALAVPNRYDTARWDVGDALASVIAKAGFGINATKTRVQYKESRQIVTGLVVNQIVNIKREYIRQARAMCRTLLKTGTFYFPDERPITIRQEYKPSLLNFIWGALIRLMRKSKPLNVRQRYPKRTSGAAGHLNQLEGMLSHIYHIKNREIVQDGVDIDKHALDHGVPDAPKKLAPLYKKIYADFLFYKNFYAQKIPVLVCEGETDIVYLKCALLSLIGRYPDLITIVDGKPKFLVKFFYHSKTTKDLLIRAEGTSGQKGVVLIYPKYTPKITAPKPTSPVIIVTDNDQGLNTIIPVLPGHTGNVNTFDRSQNFRFVQNNLYLVMTPLAQGGGETKMEDFFAPAVLATVINGKTFYPGTGIMDKTTQYGKSEFSQYVRINRNTIDFSLFAPIFDRIRSVVADYNTRA